MKKWFLIIVLLIIAHVYTGVCLVDARQENVRLHDVIEKKNKKIESFRSTAYKEPDLVINEF